MKKNLLVRKYILNDMLAAVLVWVAFVVFRKVVNDIRILDGIHNLIPNYDYLTSLFLFPFYKWLKGGLEHRVGDNHIGYRRRNDQCIRNRGWAEIFNQPVQAVVVR